MSVGAVVVMGVAGCGKSALGAALAEAEGVPFVEGDDFHSEASRAKMRRGVALTDADRAGWLDRLAGEFLARPAGAILACSALKRAYRDRLREAVAGLRFVFLEIDRETAAQRVASRGGGHYFPAALVDSQFATLEPPAEEGGVLRLAAQAPLAQLRAEASAWLRQEAGRR